MTRIALGLVWILLAADLSADERAFPDIAPLPRRAPAPASNPTTPAKVELGKQLFFDPRLSGDNQMSCASCHLPDKSFADGRRVARGHQDQLLTRNAQSCLNVGFWKQLFWDGRSKTLEEQALLPIQDKLEMHQDLDELETELGSIPAYRTAFRKVFDAAPNRVGIANALAAFQRSLITEASPFDRYLQGEKKALSEEARQGWELFRGDAGCIRCHNGPMLSDGKFHRIGVSDQDLGRAKVTGKKDDRFRFRTPSLRNVADTGPYMHDGSMKTLSDVVTFYFRGVPNKGPQGLDLDVEPLSGQSFSDIDLLVAFLKSLSGTTPKIEVPKLP